MPDIRITTYHDVFEDAFRIVTAVDLPLIVDIDTGFGNEYSITKTVKSLERIGVAGIHIEDELLNKRSAHLTNKIIFFHAPATTLYGIVHYYSPLNPRPC